LWNEASPPHNDTWNISTELHHRLQQLMKKWAFLQWRINYF
jgi:hypothetical protein